MLRTLALCAVGMCLLAACGDDDSTETGSSNDSSTPSDPEEGVAGAGIGIELADSDLGSILVDGAGHTLYLFTPDAQGESTCYDTCEANWPIVPSASSVGDGLDETLLSTTTRSNGDVQATYNGWPLYFFAGDANAGDTSGQGVESVWWVVDASGEAVQAPATDPSDPYRY